MKILILFVACACMVGCGVAEKERVPRRQAQPAQRVANSPKQGSDPGDCWFVTPSAAALSPAGKFLLLGYDSGFPGNLTLWDVETAERVAPLPGHAGGISFIAFMAGGKEALSVGHDGSLRLHRIPDGQPLRTIRAFHKWCSQVSLSGDGMHALVWGSDDGQKSVLKLWHMPSGRLLRSFGNGEPGTVALSPDNAHFLALRRTAQNYSRLDLWAIPSCTRVATLLDYEDWDPPLAFSPDGRLAVASTRRYGLALIDVQRGRLLHKFDGGGWAGVAFLPSGREIIGPEYDRSIRFWDVSTGRQVRRVNLEPAYEVDGPKGRLPKRIHAYPFSPDFARVAAVTGTNSNKSKMWKNRRLGITVRVWDLKTGRLVRAWQDDTGFTTGPAPGN